MTYLIPFLIALSFSTATAHTLEIVEVAKPIPEVREGTDGVSKVNLSNEKIKKDKPAKLTLNLSRTDGTSPQIIATEGYEIHLIAVKHRGSIILHFHPVATGWNEWQADVLFTHSGEYQVWVQFQDGKFQRRVSLIVHVD